MRRATRKAYKKCVKRLTDGKVDHLANKVRTKKLIEKMEQGGKVGVAWWAVDCDAYRAEGVTVIPATVMAVHLWAYKFWESSEGMQGYHIVKPMEGVPVETRDLALEAYENGHNHVVYI